MILWLVVLQPQIFIHKLLLFTLLFYLLLHGLLVFITSNYINLSQMMTIILTYIIIFCYSCKKIYQRIDKNIYKIMIIILINSNYTFPETKLRQSI